MDAAVNLLGFQRSLGMARWLGRGVRPMPDAGLTAESARVVITAAAFYPRRAMCLEQSLALFILLRRRGVDAQLKFGIQTLPFSAHAWVEVDGMPVNEKQDHVEQLVAFQHVSV
jgi:hypothetical protein